MKKVKNIAFNMLLIFFVVACNNKKQENHSDHLMSESNYYTCSMDPQVKEDKPGKCPICHMELILIKNTNSQSNEIMLSDQQIQLGNITTQTLSETQNKFEGNYTGVLSINQEGIKTISSRAMGRIEKLYFKSIGDFVVKNQPVYQLYSEEIAIAKQDYYTAFKQLEMPGDFGKNAKNLLYAAKQKLLFFGLSNTQIESIKKSSDVSPYTTFYSQYSGTIIETPTTEGSYVMEGAAVLKLANLNTLWVEIQVNVNYFKSLRIGQMSEVSFVDYPNKSVFSTIIFINPEINPETRLLLVRMEISNSGLLLKPGMQAIVKLTRSKIKGLFIPIDAVIQDQNSSYIWVEKSHGVFEKSMIKTGMETNGMIEIKSQIDPLKKVVIKGAYGIDSEYKFRKGSDPMEGMKM